MAGAAAIALPCVTIHGESFMAYDVRHRCMSEASDGAPCGFRARCVARLVLDVRASFTRPFASEEHAMAMLVAFCAFVITVAAPALVLAYLLRQAFHRAHDRGVAKAMQMQQAAKPSPSPNPNPNPNPKAMQMQQAAKATPNPLSGEPTVVDSAPATRPSFLEAAYPCIQIPHQTYTLITHYQASNLSADGWQDEQFDFAHDPEIKSPPSPAILHDLQPLTISIARGQAVCVLCSRL